MLDRKAVTTTQLDLSDIVELELEILTSGAASPR